MHCVVFTEVVAIRDGSLFGDSDSAIFLDDVVCRGNELTLLQCSHSGLGQYDCDPSETAGVRCGGTARYSTTLINLCNVKCQGHA